MLKLPEARRIDRLGKYRLDGVIGQGSMGVVYKGFDEDIERPVAVKVLHNHLLDGDMGADLALRFRLEAKAAALCMHNNIVTVFDYGVSEGAHYIVMEYIEGIDLKSLLQQERRIAFRQASDTIFQVLSALEHAHRNGVVHRDIKPANIMVLDNGHVKVTDFGVARLSSSDLTQAGLMIGTPAYMAPEGRVGGPVDSRTDLYAVGVVFYEILTGQRLELLKPDLVTLETQLVEAIGDQTVAEQINGLLTTALQEKQANRFENAEVFSRRLGAILTPHHKHVPDTAALAATVVRSSRRPIDALRARISDAPPVSDTAPEITPSLIEQVEKALVLYVGPMASILVRKYANQCGDMGSLLDALTSHIPSSGEQTQFRSMVDASGPSHMSGPVPRSNANRASVSIGPVRALVLSESQQRGISEMLAQHVGPMAPRLVNRAHRDATTRSEFCSRLADSIPSATERAEFLRKLDRMKWSNDCL